MVDWVEVISELNDSIQPYSCFVPLLLETTRCFTTFLGYSIWIHTGLYIPRGSSFTRVCEGLYFI